ncbi:uncharacterized protein EI90DRAFT_773222 [Cantharellus anzutake]|uniref:uncharacterized protein n=1 Tax=Cantharellus anzutake TaxID=1750568 RepID=UPI001905073D|nr:uncharacterized protein EI90DRAFT_773222 [Cantharellus anzutake]KAF8342660.1 hypothetical protein EI90DRAFT_773222 [Cantharellus anzutake]
MTHISPPVYTVWSILSVAHLGFLISHLWKFDRFRCVSTNSGAFKRVMTFAYLTALPLCSAYSIGMMVLKYREGYMEFPGFGVIPKPYFFWTEQDMKLLIPLNMIFAVAWGLEIVSHLEELCFWLFLTVIRPRHTSWLKSIQFKMWALGSVAGMVGIPLTTWLTRNDPLKCEAYMFLVGSSADLLITLVSLKILWVFPGFVDRVKSAGGEPEVVIRLLTFSDLNVTRIVFRFAFCVPVLILAIDGVNPHPHINEKALWTDFCATLAGVGLVISSAHTLLIFFPRSVERRTGYSHSRRTIGRPEGISLKPLPAHNPQAPVSQQHLVSADGTSHNHQPSYVVTSPQSKPRTLIIEDDAEYDAEEYESFVMARSSNKRTEVWEMAKHWF